MHPLLPLQASITPEEAHALPDQFPSLSKPLVLAPRREGYTALLLEKLGLLLAISSCSGGPTLGCRGRTVLPLTALLLQLRSTETWYSPWAGPVCGCTGVRCGSLEGLLGPLPLLCRLWGGRGSLCWALHPVSLA